ncbi:DUF4845 domain-containing protein [Pseudomonas sp. 10B1]|uniref:DUF4845 domain-containing protein n=1 Tax=unclassified Pseudomonas TaxID=196821 RepID=UPI002AB592A0|nr:MULTISPECIES: DUF4845 domain-containing protein [unclassified Pseudomonas]MDY7561674.1 DUF4845 domain-containing protein [Pseudomonas sp. AB6]MEA9978176.1 DUF4845 domain-containing protein [Pseudomonas sp. RTS4]MEA9994639.1 DUF4845 domain-containing protein [Pseudomonas sp. AA4]MEB0085784.1 DUF4845 domain-containing protein [Pseudomonas sp. RTI1]MEB0125891.1 DUF4845 domain-containing protein [Pseudomonas sp. CCC1.2]
MTSAVSQKGLSFFGWLLTLALVAFVASTAFKVIPHYLDYMSLKNIISSVDTDKTLEITTISDFYSHVRKGMEVNSIRDLDLNKALSVTVQNNQFLAHLKYENREPLIENIDLVIKFDHEFSVAKP